MRFQNSSGVDVTIAFSKGTTVPPAPLNLQNGQYTDIEVSGTPASYAVSTNTEGVQPVNGDIVIEPKA